MEGCVATSSDLTEARALCDAGRLDEAAALCRTVLARDVGDLAALHLLGVVLLRGGNAVEAVPLLASVAEQCADAGVLHALGEALRAVGLVDEAAARWRAAIALRPDLPESWLALGNVLLEQDEPAEAEHCFRSAIAARPDFVEALNNLGNALVALHRLEEAGQSYATALTLRPDSANTGFAYALGLLLGGDFAEGWRQFEARREVGPLRWNYQRRPELPRWQPGMALEGKRVLLMAEQGAGDVMQFVRYAPLLAARGARVVLELPHEMHGVFARMPGVARIVALEDPVADCDVACPLLSLPLYFGTTLDSIPAAVPYAAVLPERLEHWRAWLGPARGRRIGLVCSGRPEHPLDRNRSVSLQRLAPILAVPGCEFVLVQQQVRDRDQAALAAVPALRRAGSELRDYSDTAALLGLLDLVVTVDTSVAHLAGALARPVWLMLPFAPDFRWLLGRGNSLWYPTMRLYRQPARGDWDSVIAAVQRDLHGLP
ncbi:MAG TPA: tetratricopeptide repeat protein [Acetobacteraceae bacterium]|nr:tetratricopeptide repeat protein [Acetobacteraceae bacterium]